MGYVYAIGDVRLYMDTWLAYDCIFFRQKFLVTGRWL